MQRSYWKPRVDLLLREVPWLHVAGSYRRGKSEINDLDFVSTKDYKTTFEALVLCGLSSWVEIINRGQKRMRIRLSRLGQSIGGDVVICEPKDFGTAMLHCTGSAQFSIVCRTLAKKKGYKLSQYGITELATGKMHHFKTERAALAFIGRSWHEPEDR